MVVADWAGFVRRPGFDKDGAMATGPEAADDLRGAGLERDIVAVGRDRDREAFRRLFDHFAPRLHAFLRRLGVPDSTREDLVQDILASVWHRAASYDPARAAASTWIYTIARNRRIDLARRRRFPEVDLGDPATVPDPVDEAPLPDDQVGLGQMGRRLRAALAELPAEQSDIVALAYYGELSHSEIANKLGLPLGTVKSRLRLAMDKLRHVLEGLA